MQASSYSEECGAHRVTATMVVIPEGLTPPGFR